MEAIESRDVRLFDALAASRYSPFDDFSEAVCHSALGWAESACSKALLARIARSLKRRGWLEQPGWALHPGQAASTPGRPAAAGRG
ncbi:MAG TPA: hypothetical protein PK280_06305 [Planctomycetota bacterium]|nr:hypothetical protein [Planctomycetota bacterium]